MFSLLSIYFQYRRQAVAERQARATVATLPVRVAAKQAVKLPLAA